MPLSKQAKALYEAALRRKGLQPGKAVRQDPRTFVGPIRMKKAYRFPEGRDVMVPADTYWNRQGRFQDLEDELSAAMDVGIWERKNPMGYKYRRYYNDGDIPGFTNYSNTAFSYDDPYATKYRIQNYGLTISPYGRMHSRHRISRPGLTRLGELELEARADEAIENEYKNYLREMYSRYPSRRDAINEIHEHRLRDTQFYPYFEGLFPEEY